MNELMLFQKEEFGQVRVVEHNGEPWFVAKDVCECLELTNASQTLSYLDDDERDIISNDTPGGKQNMLIVSEPGLYSLVLRSRNAYTISVRETEAVAVTAQMEELPELYRRTKTTVEPDKSTIKEALKGGLTIPGCALVKTYSLQVR